MGMRYKKMAAMDFEFVCLANLPWHKWNLKKVVMIFSGRIALWHCKLDI
jgi:hypothetical protein